MAWRLLVSQEPCPDQEISPGNCRVQGTRVVVRGVQTTMGGVSNLKPKSVAPFRLVLLELSRDEEGLVSLMDSLW